ncbi:hypothetical protein [Boseongicola sp. H5]|uniref:hypothetical protein n=1 Tax=Boseongicola sp. H5 TaxID=2763261 RepID=UPI001D0A5DF9|nr:hypothetical protein [Boseongicola sp. H5]
MKQHWLSIPFALQLLVVQPALGQQSECAQELDDIEITISELSNRLDDLNDRAATLSGMMEDRPDLEAENQRTILVNMIALPLIGTVDRLEALRGRLVSLNDYTVFFDTWQNTGNFTDAAHFIAYEVWLRNALPGISYVNQIQGLERELEERLDYTLSSVDQTLALVHQSIFVVSDRLAELESLRLTLPCFDNILAQDGDNDFEIPSERYVYRDVGGLLVSGEGFWTAESTWWSIGRLQSDPMHGRLVYSGAYSGPHNTDADALAVRDTLRAHPNLVAAYEIQYARSDGSIELRRTRFLGVGENLPLIVIHDLSSIHGQTGAAMNFETYLADSQIAHVVLTLDPSNDDVTLYLTPSSVSHAITGNAYIDTRAAYVRFARERRIVQADRLTQQGEEFQRMNRARIAQIDTFIEQSHVFPDYVGGTQGFSVTIDPRERNTEFICGTACLSFDVPWMR